MSSHSKKVQNLNPHLDAWVLSEDSGFLLQSKDIHMGSHRLCLDFYDSSILYWLCLFVKNTHIRIVLHTLLLLLMDANRDQYTLSSQSQDTSSFLYFLSLRTSWDLTLLGIQLIYFLYFPVNIQICLFSVEAFMNSGASAFPHHVTVSQNCSSEESLQILCSRNSSILHCHTGAAELDWFTSKLFHLQWLSWCSSSKAFWVLREEKCYNGTSLLNDCKPPLAWVSNFCHHAWQLVQSAYVTMLWLIFVKHGMCTMIRHFQFD